MPSPNPTTDPRGYHRHTEMNRYRFRHVFGRDRHHVNRVEFGWTPPFVFDCRLPWGGRCMGIGDLFVQMHVFQRIDALCGPGVLAVQYDPFVGLAHSVWPGSELRRTVKGGCGAATVIPMRHHFLESIIPNLCEYGSEMGYPGYQLLWNLGWEDKGVDLSPLRIDWHADLPTEPPLDVITCNPVERTRGNRTVTIWHWQQTLARIVAETGCHRVWFGCSEQERVEMITWISQLDLPGVDMDVVALPLVDWYRTIRRGRRHVTGNTSGMWLAFAARHPVTVISESDTVHGEMWEPKANWFDSEYALNVELVNVTDRGSNVRTMS